MDAQDRSLLADLRAMGSEKACDWLIENDGAVHGLRLAPHLSWAKPDQTRLARWYLREIPFAQASGYRNLLKIMSVRRFIGAIEECLPVGPDGADLLAYYLPGELRKRAKTDSERELVSAFCARWGW